MKDEEEWTISEKHLGFIGGGSSNISTEEFIGDDQGLDYLGVNVMKISGEGIGDRLIESRPIKVGGISTEEFIDEWPGQP